jgi:hypothetical protein
MFTLLQMVVICCYKQVCYSKSDSCTAGKNCPAFMHSEAYMYHAYKGPSLNALSEGTHTFNVTFLEDLSIDERIILK